MSSTLSNASWPVCLALVTSAVSAGVLAAATLYCCLRGGTRFTCCGIEFYFASSTAAANNVATVEGGGASNALPDDSEDAVQWDSDYLIATSIPLTQRYPQPATNPQAAAPSRGVSTWSSSSTARRGQERAAASSDEIRAMLLVPTVVEMEPGPEDPADFADGASCDNERLQMNPLRSLGGCRRQCL